MDLLETCVYLCYMDIILSMSYLIWGLYGLCAMLFIWTARYVIYNISKWLVIFIYILYGCKIYLYVFFITKNIFIGVFFGCSIDKRRLSSISIDFWFFWIRLCLPVDKCRFSSIIDRLSIPMGPDKYLIDDIVNPGRSPWARVQTSRCPDELVGYRKEEGRMEQLVYDHM